MDGSRLTGRRRALFFAGVVAGLLPILAQGIFAAAIAWTPLGSYPSVRPISEQAWLANFLFFGIALGATSLFGSMLKGGDTVSGLGTGLATIALTILIGLMFLLFGFSATFDSGSAPYWIVLNAIVVVMAVPLSYIVDVSKD